MSVIALSHGETHYELAGPEDGRPLVLLHGVTADTDVPAHDIVFLREVIPQVDYVELERVRHGSLFLAADRVNEVLLEFLTATSGSLAAG